MKQSESKKKIQLFIKTFLIFIILGIFPPILTAQDAQQGAYPISEYLFHYAKKLYEQGDIENAKHEFSKLLIIEPDNAAARQYLKKMGLERGLYRTTGRLALEEGSIYSENLQLREENLCLKTLIARLKKDIAQRDSLINMLAEAIRKGNSDSAARIGDYRDKITAMENLIAAKNTAILNLHQALKEEGLKASLRDKQLEIGASGVRQLSARAEEYAQQVRLLQEDLEVKNKELEELNAEFDAYRLNSKKWSDLVSGQLQEQLREIGGLNRRVSLLQQRLNEAEEQNAQKDTRLLEFAEKLSALESSFRGKQAEAAALNETIRAQKQDLEARLFGKDFEITRQGEEISGQSEAIGELRRQVSSVNEQLGASEESGREKDRRITSVTGQLAQISADNLNKEEQIRRLQAVKLMLEEAGERQAQEFEARMSAMKELMASQEAEIAALNKELKIQQQALEKRLEEKELELADKYAQVEELNIRLKKADSRIEEAKKENADKDAWIESLNKNVRQLEDASQGELTKYLEKINSFEDALKAKEEELSALKKDFGLRSQRLEEELSARKAELSSGESEIKRLGGEINNKEKELVIIRNSFDAKNKQIADLKHDFEARRKKLQQRISDAEKESANNSSQVKMLKGELDKLEKSLKDAKLEAADSRAEADSRQQELLVQEKESQERSAAMAQLEGRLASVQDELKQALEEKAARENDAGRLKQKIKELELSSSKELGEYLDKLNLLESAFKSKGQELDSLTQQFASYKEDISGEIADKQKELGEKAAQVQGLSADLDLARQYLQEAEKAKMEKDAVIADLQEGIKGLQEKEKESAELKNTVSLLDGRLKEYKEKIDSLASSLKEKQEEIARLNSGFNSDREELRRQLAAKEEQLAQNTAKIEELGRQLEERNNLLASSENFLNAKDKALAQLGAELDSFGKDMDKKLSAKDREIAVRQARIAELNSQLDAAMKELSEAEKARSEGEARISRMQDDISELKDSLGGRAAEYEDKLNKLKDSIADKEKELAQTSERVGDLLRQKDNLEAEANQQIMSLKGTMERLQKSLQSEIDDYKAKLELAERGIVVTVLTDIAFDSGKAEILPEGQKIIDKISSVLKDIGPDNHIVIEGHTDNVPITYSGWRSNWELSAARALAVLHQLIDKGGLSPDRFSVTGYGEYRPVTDNGTEHLRRQNRRVEIVIQPPKIIKVKSQGAVAAVEDEATAPAGVSQ